jgi:Lon-like protease
MAEAHGAGREVAGGLTLTTAPQRSVDDGRDEHGRRRSSTVERMWSRVRELLPHPRARVVLGAMRVFAGCTRRQLFRLARWGDVFEARPGEVLLREGHTDYWFIVVLSGSVRLTRGGRVIGALGPGDHFGETSIVGFRPQTATAVAAEPTMLFVLGRRYLLSLATLDASIQNALFPQVPPGGYRRFVQELHADGRPDWEKLGARRERLGVAPAPARPRGRRLTWNEAIEQLAGDDGRRAPARSDNSSLRHLESDQPSFVRSWAVTIAVAALMCAALLYHPPIAVVTPGTTIDVAGDITISGAHVHPLNGRYLLAPVHVRRPNLVRSLYDFVAGHTIVRTRDGEHPVDPGVPDEGRGAFLASHRHAIAAAERALGVDGTRVKITIRDRSILGPSAGLVYALAIVDMLDHDDLAAGRTVAATGELADDGSVGPVGFVAIKAQAALRGHAAVFLVPWEQLLDTRTTGLEIEGVESLSDAMRQLVGADNATHRS